MAKVLFICSASVGRSKMAAGYYNHLTGTADAKSAAGVERLREKYENRPHPLVVQMMASEGIDISDQEITYLDEVNLGDFDTVVAFCPPEHCMVDISQHPDVRYVNIADPAGIGMADDQFAVRLEHSQREIRKAVMAMLGRE